MKKTMFLETLILLMLSAVLIQPVIAQNVVFYNDCVGPASGSAPNVTHYSGYLGGGGGFEDPDGYLIDYITGVTSSAFVQLSASNLSGSLGSMPNAGTDAYNIFNGIVNLSESASYNSSSFDWYYEATFTGLDPNWTYSFVTTVNRNGSSYGGDGSNSRWTQFSIIGADQYTNASSAGVVEVTTDVLKMNTGYNTVNGYIIRWTGISTADGSFTIRSENVGSDGPGEAKKSYGLQGFMLEGISGGAPIPEPGTFLLLGSGFLGLGLVGYFRRKRA